MSTKCLGWHLDFDFVRLLDRLGRNGVGYQGKLTWGPLISNIFEIYFARLYHHMNCFSDYSTLSIRHVLPVDDHVIVSVVIVQLGLLIDVFL